MASVVAVWCGCTALISEPPASTKQSAVSGIIGIPPGFHSVMMGELKPQPPKTRTPRSATAAPATMGTRSKKPTEELRRPDGLSATSLGFAMLRVGPENLFGKLLQCNSARAIAPDFIARFVNELRKSVKGLKIGTPGVRSAKSGCQPH